MNTQTNTTPETNGSQNQLISSVLDYLIGDLDIGREWIKSLVNKKLENQNPEIDEIYKETSIAVKNILRKSYNDGKVTLEQIKDLSFNGKSLSYYKDQNDDEEQYEITEMTEEEFKGQEISKAELAFNDQINKRYDIIGKRIKTTYDYLMKLSNKYKNLKIKGLLNKYSEYNKQIEKLNKALHENKNERQLNKSIENIKKIESELNRFIFQVATMNYFIYMSDHPIVLGLNIKKFKNFSFDRKGFAKLILNICELEGPSNKYFELLKEFNDFLIKKSQYKKKQS